MNRSLRSRLHVKMLHDLAECTMNYIEQTDEHCRQQHHEQTMTGLYKSIYHSSNHQPFDDIRYNKNRKFYYNGERLMTDYHQHKLISNFVVKTCRATNIDEDLVGRIFGDYMFFLDNATRRIFYTKCTSTKFISDILKVIIDGLWETKKEFSIHCDLKAITLNWMINLNRKI